MTPDPPTQAEPQRPDEAPMCRRCGLHHPGPDHDIECAWQAFQRSRVVALAGRRGVPEATAADLWAHLQTATGLCAEGAARASCRVLDLGWRPVVGTDSRRLWDPAKEFDR